MERNCGNLEKQSRRDGAKGQDRQGIGQGTLLESIPPSTISLTSVMPDEDPAAPSVPEVRAPDLGSAPSSLEVHSLAGPDMPSVHLAEAANGEGEFAIILATDDPATTEIRTEKITQGALTFSTICAVLAYFRRKRKLEGK